MLDGAALTLTRKNRYPLTLDAGNKRSARYGSWLPKVAEADPIEYTYGWKGKDVPPPKIPNQAISQPLPTHDPYPAAGHLDKDVHSSTPQAPPSPQTPEDQQPPPSSCSRDDNSSTRGFTTLVTRSTGLAQPSG